MKEGNIFMTLLPFFTLIFDLGVTLKLCTVTLTTIIHRNVQMVKNGERVCLKRPKKGERMCQKSGPLVQIMVFLLNNTLPPPQLGLWIFNTPKFRISNLPDINN